MSDWGVPTFWDVVLGLLLGLGGGLLLCGIFTAARLLVVHIHAWATGIPWWRSVWLTYLFGLKKLEEEEWWSKK